MQGKKYKNIKELERSQMHKIMAHASLQYLTVTHLPPYSNRLPRNMIHKLT